jgi:hypothetical protein
MTNDDFCSDSILFLTTLSMKQCMYIEVRPIMCGDSMLPIVDYSCCLAL